MSTTASKMADSSMAGSAEAAWMYCSISSGMCSKPYMSTIFLRTSCWYALMLESASISCAHRRSEEHTSELQSHSDLVCRLLLEKKKKRKKKNMIYTKNKKMGIAYYK